MIIDIDVYFNSFQKISSCCSRYCVKEKWSGRNLDFISKDQRAELLGMIVEIGIKTLILDYSLFYSNPNIGVY
jgi:hypothetical protein